MSNCCTFGKAPFHEDRAVGSRSRRNRGSWAILECGARLEIRGEWKPSLHVFRVSIQKVAVYMLGSQEYLLKATFALVS